MSNSIVHYTFCLVLLTSCVDHGDGRWKKKERESFRYDIEMFNKMAEKIEREIEDFYDEYPEEQVKTDNNYEIHNKDSKASIKYPNILIKNRIKEESGDKHSIYSRRSDMTNDVPSNNVVKENLSNKSNSSIHVSFVNKMNESIDGVERSKSSWPKFEDILLAMGRRYDWKNDRWIKMKRKLKDSRDKIKEIQNADFHEKHKFSYKIVKLGNKSKRNVVVAVSAVR